MPKINPLTGLEYSPKPGTAESAEEKKINPLTGLEYSPTQSLLSGRSALPGTGIDLSEYTDPLSAYRKYNVPTRAGIDWNEVRAQNQPLSEKITYGVGKLLTTAASTAIGGTLGFYYGIAKGLVNFDISDVWDNEVTRATFDFNNHMSEVLPHYYTRDEMKPKTLAESVGNSNFWTDKFMNGVGFMAGAFATGLLTGGGGLISRGVGLGTRMALQGVRAANRGKFANAVTSTGKLMQKAEAISRTPAGRSILQRGYNAMSFGEASTLMAASEASIEALDIKERIYQEQLSNFLEANPEYDEYTVPEEVKTQFERISDAAGNSAFGMNMATLLISNHLQFGKLLNRGAKPTLGVDVSKLVRLGKDGIEEVAASRLSKLASRSKPYIGGMVTEAFQEGVQFGIGEYQVATKIENKSMYEGFNEALSQMFGSVEGLESMVLGALIGGPGALLTRKGRVKEREAKEKIVADILKNQEGWSRVLKNVEVNEANQQILDILDLAAKLGNEELHSRALAALLSNSAARMYDAGVLDMHLQLLDKAKLLSDEEFIEEFGYDKEVGLPKSKEEIVDDLKQKLTKLAEIRQKVMDMRSTLPAPGLFGRIFESKDDRKMQQEAEDYYLNVIYNRLANIELANEASKERQKNVDKLLEGSAASLNLGSIELPYGTTTKAEIEEGKTKEDDKTKSEDPTLIDISVPTAQILDESKQLSKAIETLRKEGKVAEAEKLAEWAAKHVNSMKGMAKLVEAYDQIRKLPFTREGYFQLLDAKKENQRKVEELRQKQIDEEARIAIAEATTVEELDAAIRPETDPKLKAQAKARRKELQKQAKKQEKATQPTTYDQAKEEFEKRDEILKAQDVEESERIENVQGEQVKITSYSSYRTKDGKRTKTDFGGKRLSKIQFLNEFDLSNPDDIELVQSNDPTTIINVVEVRIFPEDSKRKSYVEVRIHSQKLRFAFTPTEEQRAVSPGTPIGKPGTQAKAFEVEETGKIDESIEGVTANGNSIIVNGQEYINPNYTNPADAISKTVDENGIVTIEYVQLETKSGEQVRFVEKQAEDIAYIITLASMQKSVQPYEQLELDFTDIVEEAKELQVEEPVDVSGLKEEVRYINELLLDAYDVQAELRAQIKEAKNNPELKAELNEKFKELGKNIGYFKSLRTDYIKQIAKVENKSQSEVRAELDKITEASKAATDKINSLEDQIAKLEAAIADLENALDQAIQNRASATKNQQKAITKQINSLKRKIKYRQNKLDKLYRAYEETEIQPEFDSAVDGEELTDEFTESTQEQVDSGEATDTVDTEDVESEHTKQTEEAEENAKESGDPIEDAATSNEVLSIRQRLSNAIDEINNLPRLVVDPENEDYYMEEGNSDGPRYKRVTARNKPSKAIPKVYAHRGTIIDSVLRNVFKNSNSFLELSEIEQLQTIATLLKEASESDPEIAKSKVVFSQEFINEFTITLNKALSIGKKRNFQYITDLPAFKIQTKDGVFAGTLDMIIVDPSRQKIHIIDFKTSSRNRLADYVSKNSLYLAKDNSQLSHYILGLTQAMNMTESEIQKFIQPYIMNFTIKQGASPKTINALEGFDVVNPFAEYGSFHKPLIDAIKELQSVTQQKEETPEEKDYEEKAVEPEVKEPEETKKENLVLNDVDVRLAIGEFELDGNQLEHDANGDPIPGLVEIKTSGATIRLEHNALADPEVAAKDSVVELELREDTEWWKENKQNYKGEEWKGVNIFVKQNGRYIGMLAQYNQTDKSGSSRQEIYSRLKKGEAVSLKVSQKLFSNWTVSKNNKGEVVFRNLAEEFPNASLYVANQGSAESPQEWLPVHRNPNESVNINDLTTVLYWDNIRPQPGVAAFTVKDPNGRSIAIYGSTRLLTNNARVAAEIAIMEEDLNRFTQIVGLNTLPDGAYAENAMYYANGMILMKVPGYTRFGDNTMIGVYTDQLAFALAETNTTPTRFGFYTYHVEDGQVAVEESKTGHPNEAAIREAGIVKIFKEALKHRRFQVAELEKQPSEGKFLNPVDRKTIHNSYYDYITRDWGLEPREKGTGSNAILTASTFNNNGSVFFNIGLKFENEGGENQNVLPATPTVPDTTPSNATVTSESGVSKRKRNRGKKATPSNYVSPTKIISGGQTGADRIGLEVAKELGITTGGTAPKGYKTEKGADISLKSFGLQESTSTNYKERTTQNIQNSDATVIFAESMQSAGTKLTLQTASKLNKPVISNPTAEELQAFIQKNNVKILNVAGNRGSKMSIQFQQQSREVLKTALQSEKVESKSKPEQRLSPDGTPIKVIQPSQVFREEIEDRYIDEDRLYLQREYDEMIRKERDLNNDCK